MGVSQKFFARRESVGLRLRSTEGASLMSPTVHPQAVASPVSRRAGLGLAQPGLPPDVFVRVLAPQRPPLQEADRREDGDVHGPGGAVQHPLRKT